MSIDTKRRRSRVVRAIGSLAVFALVSSGCGDEAAVVQNDTAPVEKREEATVATAMQAALVCTGSGAHDAHTAITSCQTCHACAGYTGFGAPVMLPGGTSTDGGVIDQSGAVATCTVACHYPFGGAQRSVEWRPGSLMCTSCHGAVQAADIVTSHPVDFTDVASNRASCQNCHQLGTHLTGEVTIDLGNGSSVVVSSSGDPSAINPACQACHDGSGKTLASRVPVLLSGWDSPSGDFHGSRKGLATGYGGTLLAPYVRQQPALGCTVCHDAHSSATQYLFAREVNATPVVGTISHQGVGADALCGACHQGARHQKCIDCHRNTGICLVGVGGTTPSDAICAGGTAVDPGMTSTACFFCHGHEGIVNFPEARFPSRHPNGQDVSCQHCHAREGGMPWYERTVDTTPPSVIANAVTVSNVTGSSATVTWRTAEMASSYVEVQDGTTGLVFGDAGPRLTHMVQLTGLGAGKTYSVRARSTDAHRNVAFSTVTTVATTAPGAPSAPVLVDEPGILVPTDPASATLQWNPVVSPLGNPLEYRLVLDGSGAFTTFLVDSGWISGTSLNVTLPAYTGEYFWKVVARDATTGTTGPWSNVDRFQLWPDWEW